MSELIPILTGGLDLVELDRAQSGRNAGDGRLTRARTDAEAVMEWLERCESPKTRMSYRREAERLLLWCQSRGQALADLSAGDMRAYQDFLRDPQPTALWCMQPEPKTLQDGSPNPDWRAIKPQRRRLPTGELNPNWRPFVSGLGPTAVGHAMTVMHGMLEHLCAIDWLAKNPISAAGLKRKRPPNAAGNVERYLEPAVWQHVLDYLESMPQSSTREIAHYQRSKFVTLFLFSTALRREELATRTTAHIIRVRGDWWLQVLGKGNKQAEIPLNDAAISALQEYRVSLGRSPLPEPGADPEPLVMDICGRGAPLSGNSLYSIVGNVFRGAAAACPDPYHRHALELASVHWLRHTTATYLINGQSGGPAGEDRPPVPLQIAQMLLRHDHIATTGGYLHADKEQLVRAMQSLKTGARQRSV